MFQPSLLCSIIDHFHREDAVDLSANCMKAKLKQRCYHILLTLVFLNLYQTCVKNYTSY